RRRRGRARARRRGRGRAGTRAARRTAPAARPRARPATPPRATVPRGARVSYGGGAVVPHPGTRVVGGALGPPGEEAHPAGIPPGISSRRGHSRAVISGRMAACAPACGTTTLRRAVNLLAVNAVDVPGEPELRLFDTARRLRDQGWETTFSTPG